MAENKNCGCGCGTEQINVPVTGITMPLCGFGVNIDAGSLEGLGGLSREEIQEMIDNSLSRYKVDPYILCEFYTFRHPVAHPGFAPGALSPACTWEFPSKALLCFAGGSPLHCVTSATARSAFRARRGSFVQMRRKTDFDNEPPSSSAYAAPFFVFELPAMP